MNIAQNIRKKQKRIRNLGNYYVVLKTMNDMAKIFGKNDEIYSNKNEIDKAVEEQIKDTITMKKVSTALEKEKYDIA